MRNGLPPALWRGLVYLWCGHASASVAVGSVPRLFIYKNCHWGLMTILLMASCYICGDSGASYRRTVTTGKSFGSFWSKRSYGSSTRTYYGTRTVCESCAASIDKWNIVKTCFFLVLVAAFLLYQILKP